MKVGKKLGGFQLPESKQAEIRKVFDRLYPGENIEKKYYFYRKRKRSVMIACMIAGVGMFVCAQVSSHMQHKLEDATYLTRNEWGAGDYFVTLHAKTVSEEGDITYQVRERLLSEDELENLFVRAKEELAEIILAENESLLYVTKKLNLTNSIQGYPFQISWRSSDYNKIRTDGMVKLDEIGPEEEMIRLTAIFSYEDFVRETTFDVWLFPPVQSEKEKYLQKIAELLAKQDFRLEKESKLYLPGEMDGEKIVWSEKQFYGSFLWLVLGGVFALFCSCKMDNDLKEKRQIRKEEIVRSYPEFVSKLKLYMGAGLTIRNAFLRIGKDYGEEKKQTGKSEYLYEEVLLAGYQLLNGKSEEYVYQEWGRRCETMCCRKLGFLLTATLRQGNEKILFMLEQEACLAWEDRKAKVKKHGEEAGTKMLFPMLMMLLMVMFLVLLPAFSGFQGA